MITRKSQVRRYTQRQIERLNSQRGESGGRAALAQLRRGVGCEPGALPMLWGAFLAGLPEELRSISGAATRGEWAVYTALTLFALHQQGKSDSVQADGVSLGSAALRLSGGTEEGRARVWKRLNLVARADDMLEMSYRLRQLVTLLKAEGVGLDYALLAADVYEYQDPEKANRVRLRWGQDFYTYSRNEEDESNE